jgi:hypothetical protein
MKAPEPTDFPTYEEYQEACESYWEAQFNLAEAYYEEHADD